MERFTNAALFGISFVAIFGMGALHPYLGFTYLAVWLFGLLPFFWRRAARFNLDAQIERKKRNIETQIIQGKLDAQYIAEVTAEMKRQGRL